MWISKIPPIVFTRVKTKGEEVLKTKYPNIFFTTSSKVSTAPKFPTIYLEKLQGGEEGGTFERGAPEAISSSFQVIVTDNTSQNNANEVADVVADILYDMGYEILGDPTPSYSDGTYQSISRYRRTVGNNDIL